MKLEIFARNKLLSLGVLLLGFAFETNCIVSAQEENLSQLSQQLAPVFDEGCIVFAHVDLDRCDLDQLTKKVQAWGIPLNPQAQDYLKSIKQTVKRAGGRHVFVTFSLIDLSGTPVVSIPLGEKVSKEVLGELLKLNTGPKLKSTYLSSSRLMVAAAPETLNRIQLNQSPTRDDLNELLKSVGPEVASLRFVPTADHLRVIHEFKNELLPNKLNIDVSALSDGIQTGSLVLKSVEPLNLQLSIRSASRKGAESLAKLVRSLPQLVTAGETEKVVLRLMASGIQVSADEPGLVWEVGDNEMEIWKLVLQPAISNANRQVKATTEVNNMKMMLLGMHNFHDVYRGFPDLGLPKDKSKPGLSWRVHILPYIEEMELYNQFHLDEPWDSDHNLKLVEKMPSIFRTAGKTEPGKTQFVMPRGKGFFASPYAAEKHEKIAFAGRTFRDILDGTSNTIAVLKVDPKNAVVWSKPADWNPTPEKIKELLAAKHGTTLNFAAADGAVHRVEWKKLNVKKLQSMLTIAGDELVDFHSDVNK